MWTSFLVRTSANWSLVAQSFISLTVPWAKLCFMLAKSTHKRLSSTSLVDRKLLHKPSWSVTPIIGRLTHESRFNISHRIYLTYTASSSPSDKLNPSAAMVDLTTLLIVPLFQTTAPHRPLETKNTIAPAQLSTPWDKWPNKASVYTTNCHPAGSTRQGNITFERSLFSLTINFNTLLRSDTVQIWNLVLRSTMSKARSGLVPCTTQFNVPTMDLYWVDSSSLSLASVDRFLLAQMSGTSALSM